MTSSPASHSFPRIWCVAALLACGGCTFQVDSTADAPDANPGDNRCADARGRCTLRAALMEANAGSLSRRIEVPAGTYLVDLPTASGGGPLEINGNVMVRGAGAAKTIIDAGAVSYDGNGGCPSPGSSRTVFRILGGNVGLAYLTVQGGYAQNGGGIRVDGGTVEIQDSVIRRNAAFTGAGGLLVASGIVRVRRTSIIENCATGAFGGGINNSSGAQLWIYESLIARNQSNRAGAIRNSGNLNLRNTTVSGNIAVSPSAGTGGISQNGFAFLNNVTLTLNVGRGTDPNSFRGGGLHTVSGRTTVVKNSILAANDGQGGPTDCAGDLTSDSRYNLIGDSGGCGLPSNTSTYLLNVGAQIGPLASNLGPTQTHALSFSSPAYEAGYRFPQPAADGCEPWDQRGVPRPQGRGRCDLGAYETGNANSFVTSFVLVNADSNADLFTLRNGELLNLSELPPHLNIRAETNAAPGSVVFSWDGDPSFQIENNAPYALGGDSPVGNYNPFPITSGAHTLRATPHASAGGAGAGGGSLEVKFTAIGGPG